MTPEDEAFEELDRKLNTKRIAKAMTNLNKELEKFRNEVIEEIATNLENEFKIPFAQDTVASFAVYIRGMKCADIDGKNSKAKETA